MYPVGRIPSRSISASHSASDSSSVCLSPLYCWMAVVFASFTESPAAINPSPSQYQLNVDSTTTPASRSRYGANACSILRRSFSSRRRYSTLPAPSFTTTTLLLEFRPIPPYTVVISTPPLPGLLGWFRQTEPYNPWGEAFQMIFRVEAPAG